MKNVIILGSRQFGSKNNPEHLATALRAMPGAQVSTVWFEDILVDISTQEVRITDIATGTALRDADLVIALGWYKHGLLSFYLDIAYTVALYLDHHKVPFWNSEMLHQRSTTKLSAMALLALQGLPVARTIFTLNKDKLAEEAASLGWPCILKGAAASRGNSNFRVKDQDELQGILETIQDKPMLLQEYLPNDFDLRVVCIAGDPSLVIKRSRTTDATHLNNTSRGGHADVVELADLPQNVLQMCQKACLIFGRELAGVDIMPLASDPSKYIFLEVNAIPQLTTGSFVDKKMHVLADNVARFLDSKEAKT